MQPGPLAARAGPAPGAQRTEVEVVHAVGEEDVIQQGQPRVLGAFVELVAPVSAAHVSLCGEGVQGAR